MGLLRLPSNAQDLLKRLTDPQKICFLSVRRLIDVAKLKNALGTSSLNAVVIDPRLTPSYAKILGHSAHSTTQLSYLPACTIHAIRAKIPPLGTRYSNADDSWVRGLRHDLCAALATLPSWLLVPINTYLFADELGKRNNVVFG